MTPERTNWGRALLAADWNVKHWTLQALLPGLTAGEIKSIKHKEREARERRRYCCKMLRAEVMQNYPPAQLELPLPKPHI